MRSYLTELQCSRCKRNYTADVLQNLCACGAPLLAQYDLKAVTRVLSREDFGYRVHSMWRYKEVLPVRNPENIITLSEGFTPLIKSRAMGKRLGLESLFFKDESFNPTASFKARGLSVAISRARELGVTEVAIPTAGNAGGAASAYAACAGMKCHVFMPKDTPPAFEKECQVYGADIHRVDGYITDAAAEMQKQIHDSGWFDVSTMKEPYRVEGKKTILFELAQQLNWVLPDTMIFPTGGGTGIVGAWKAIHELKELDWPTKLKLPRLVAVQAEGCAPLVRAFGEGLDYASPWENPSTAASGLRVPQAVADFLILRAIRESEGTAVAVSEDDIREASQELAHKEGLYVAPEAAAGLAGLQKLTNDHFIDKSEIVVLILTGSGLKYIGPIS